MTDDALAQRIDHLRDDMHDDLVDIKDQLKSLLPREVYEVRHQQLADRVTALEAQRAEDAKQRRADRRWILGVVVVPVVIAVVQIALTLGGPS